MSACACRYCAKSSPPAAPAAQIGRGPVELPSEPRRFLAHTGCGPQDCTLHPDGSVIMRAGGQLYRSAFSFAEMREMGKEGQHWADHRLQWDPTDDDVAYAMENPPDPGQGDLFGAAS